MFSAIGVVGGEAKLEGSETKRREDRDWGGGLGGEGGNWRRWRRVPVPFSSTTARRLRALPQWQSCGGWSLDPRLGPGIRAHV